MHDASAPQLTSMRAVQPTCLVRPDGQLNAIARRKFGHNACDMEFHCAHADVQLLADLGIRHSSGDRQQYVFLAVGERIVGLRSGVAVAYAA